MKLEMKYSGTALSLLFLLSGCGSSSSNDNDTTPGDTTPPVLQTSIAGTESAVTHTSVWTFDGNVTDDGGVKTLTLELNGETSEVGVENGRFNVAAALKAGANPYTLTASDESGNETTISGSVYLGHTTAAGGSHSGALYNGELYAWGRNNYGQTGLGYTSSLSDSSSGAHPATPFKLTTPDTNAIVSISFNQNFSIALDEAGNVWSWGDNSDGELGRGASTDICGSSATEPDCILAIGQVQNLTDVVAISAGYSHTLALKNDGTVWAFGTNGDGELGTGDANATAVPVQTVWTGEQSVNVVQVSAGSDFSCALDDQGRLWAWGKNNYGQLGQGAKGNDDQLTPIEVPFAEGVKIVSVATGKGHALALDANGTVYGWGLNASSQVGYYGYQYKGTDDAWASYVLSPAEVVPADADNPVVAVFANGNSSYILRADKKIYPWGQYGETDETGKTSYANLDLPEDKLTAVTSVKDVAAGALHMVAVQEDGTVFTWRWSFEGSLGGGESTVNAWMYNYPVKPVFPE